MHQFIEEYFKDNIDSIKKFHNKLNRTSENQKKEEDIVSTEESIEEIEDYSTYTIYQKKKNFYAIKNDDPKTVKHLKYFTLVQINQMHISSLFFNKSMFDEFILSFI